MSGHASHIAPIVDDGAAIRVPVLGQGNPVAIIDARPKMHWTEDEVTAAVETQQKRAGALVALVRERTEATWAELRRELNEAAGGQASARVMVLAHHALRAHQALELQTLLAEQEAGEEGKKVELHLRNQSGLSVIATQALEQAFAAARGEAAMRESRGGHVQGLMAKLGVGQKTQREVQVASPFAPPGGDQTGSLSPFPPTSGDSE